MVTALSVGLLEALGDTDFFGVAQLEMMRTQNNEQINDEKEVLNLIRLTNRNSVRYNRSI